MVRPITRQAMRSPTTIKATEPPDSSRILQDHVKFEN